MGGVGRQLGVADAATQQDHVREVVGPGLGDPALLDVVRRCGGGALAGLARVGVGVATALVAENALGQLAGEIGEGLHGRPASL